MKPVVDRLEAEFAGRVDFQVFSEVNSDPAAGALAASHGVRAIPAMMVVSPDGTELDRHLGGLDDEGLRSFIDRALPK